MVAKWLQAAGNLNQQIPKGAFFNYVDKILAFFDLLSFTLTLSTYIYLDKKAKFLDNLPTSSCKHS
jgi:hypothetical protein